MLVFIDLLDLCTPLQRQSLEKEEELLKKEQVSPLIRAQLLHNSCFPEPLRVKAHTACTQSQGL